MRIAVLDRELCQPKKCSKECINFCPKVRSGEEAVVVNDEDGKPEINESICIGCNICVRKCPFKAITIVNLPEELEEQAIHRFGENGFVLYRLPFVSEGDVTGILGPNGIGKTTALKILSGDMLPNLGGEASDWSDIIEHFNGSILQTHFEKIKDQDIKISIKPQHIRSIPKASSGQVGELLEGVDERGVLDEMAERLQLKHVWDRKLDVLSGGELQRVAIAACLSRKADLYFMDEVTPYLDIYQRKRVASFIRDMPEESTVLIIEHDIAILDLLTDRLHLGYGDPGAYGIITKPKGVRKGINQYLDGFLPDENIRIRSESIDFKQASASGRTGGKELIELPNLVKEYEDFKVELDGGQLYQGETVGIVGPNAIGKTTVVSMLAGKTEPKNSDVNLDLKISYKPQYIKADVNMDVGSFLATITSDYGSSYYKTRIMNPLSLDELVESKINDLSGGELQRVAIAACLSRKADIYILDEPSAHLDVEQRTMAIKTIKRVVKNMESSALVVDHDIYMIDLLSDRLMVFDGEPGIEGHAHGPYNMRKGMNMFLKNLGITFRRDEDTKRPRINKENSHLDRKQKRNGEYYYL
ncbi:Translation initiation factor RLI1 containing Fe-S and AAA+ ATPase domain [Methanonatronarchaeum thermophilum]|uniref:Translation initiation factor RLI1 containing Fe-S and AAA+ ATPase domain n=1 Tax=Methanonatronarchaeum thermophilum TaxID=1927129 RepID=A0A1Y3GB12_9EURY|nr:ribosome biogenesis/translation initiation ATPase RLI [Methanonatronarchaeum thermophilum]OUJ18608.1 Translation initiation factor RLI1 containing Fe-S and AAA+ ATPase domain [Methanonatronarchaeum thermophilum]